MHYGRFVNPISAGRYLMPLRKLTEIQTKGGPNLLALGTGAPNPNCFPFKAITVESKDDHIFKLEGKVLGTALSYGASPGMPDFIQWLKDFQMKIHNPPTANRKDADEAKMDLIVLPGSQDGLCKALEMLMQPGDYVLMEEPTYPGNMAVLKPYGPRLLTLKSDEHGITPESLRNALSKWSWADVRKQEVKMPKFLAVQPNHCNPTGATIPLERRREIYKIAQDYDLLIIEDDAYYFITYDGLVNTILYDQGDALKELSDHPPGIQPGKAQPQPSFLSLDTDGRVLRLDSFSKIMSAGIRMGVLTGPKALVNQILMHVANSSVQCNTLSQVIVSTLLKDWGHDGFLEHTKRVAQFYESQCQKMLEAAEKHLKDLAEWHAPHGGMFLWFKVKGVKDTNKMIMEGAMAKQVVLAPGTFFMVDDRPTPYLRASYSAVTEEQMNLAFERLAELIREEQVKTAEGG